MTSNMEEKINHAKSVALYTSIVTFIILGYLFAYLGSLLSDGYNLISAFLEMIYRVKHFDVLFSITMNSFTGILFALMVSAFICFYMFMDAETHIAYNRNEVGGTGGFMTKQDLKKYNERYVEPEKKTAENGKYYSPNMILAKSFKRTINDRKSGINNNILMIGIAGVGKSRSIMKPNIMQMNATYVINDPSGELLTSLGTPLRNNGYKVKVFNISDMLHSNKYNPLKYIMNTADIATVIDCLIKNTTDKDMKGDEFFPNAEKLLYSACIAYLLEHCNDDERKNFNSVLKMVNSSSIDENNPNASSTLDDLFDSLPKNSLAKAYYTAFKKGAGRTLKSIIISCVVRLRPFMTPEVSALTQYDELELEKLGDEKTALFIILPQADSTYSFLPAMLYTQLFYLLYRRGEEQKAESGSERLKYHVRCMMDEFYSTGVVPGFPGLLSTMRKYNISATIALQDKQQLEELYKDSWRTIIANCSSMIYLGGNENDTKKYIEEALGYMTIMERSYNEQRGRSRGSSRGYKSTKREVRMAEEIGRMDQDKCMVFTVGNRPIFDKKYDISMHPMYKYIYDNEDTKELLFQYKKMAVFDTRKPVNLNNLLKAEKEAARIQKEKMITDPRLVKDIDTDKTVEEILNGFMLDEAKEKYYMAELLEECIVKALNCNNSKIAVVRLKSMPGNVLRSITMQAALTLDMAIVAFSENHPQNMNGIYYDFSNDQSLLNAVLNDYVLSKDKLMDSYQICIRKGVFEEYKNTILNQV